MPWSMASLEHMVDKIVGTGVHGACTDAVKEVRSELCEGVGCR